LSPPSTPYKTLKSIDWLAKNPYNKHMDEYLISARNNVNSLIYKHLLKKIFFRMDPEDAHDRMMVNGSFLGKFSLTKELISIIYNYKNKALEQKILGIKFANPIGLSAGFDKNAQLTDILPSIGFGFEEVGSITGEPCAGNPKPRLWRLVKSKSLVVYYGLKNNGAIEIAKKLKNKKFDIPIGISIAKTNCQETVDLEKGVEDYVKGFKQFTEIGAYYTINISCPNTFGGQPFTDAKSLDKLLTKIDKIPTKKPIFIKLSPDLSKKEVDDVLEISKKHRVHGFVCTNLTKNRKNKKIKDENVPDKGGISGKVVEDLSNDLIKYIFDKTKGKYVIIGVGGVSNASDAYKKIKAGASLIQMITGMVFEGPQVISQINQGLVKLLKKDGFRNISEAVGKD